MESIFKMEIKGKIVFLKNKKFFLFSEYKKTGGVHQLYFKKENAIN